VILGNPSSQKHPSKLPLTAVVVRYYYNNYLRCFAYYDIYIYIYIYICVYIHIYIHIHIYSQGPTMHPDRKRLAPAEKEISSGIRYDGYI